MINTKNTSGRTHKEVSGICDSLHASRSAFGESVCKGWVKEGWAKESGYDLCCYGSRSALRVQQRCIHAGVEANDGTDYVTIIGSGAVSRDRRAWARRRAQSG